MAKSNFCVGQNKHSRCKILTVDKCKGESCSFIQTKEQADISQEKSFKRLTSLSQERQSHISNKYYDGKMPWLKGGVEE